MSFRKRYTPPLFAALLLLQMPLSVPFLDWFNQRAPSQPAVEQSVVLNAGGRQMAAYLVTPAPTSPTRLPAVLLASGREGLTDALRRFARELAGIGYVALSVDYRGDRADGGSALLKEVTESSADLIAAADWLAAQPSVDAERVAVLAWNDASDAAAKLAATGKAKDYPAHLDSQLGISEQEWVAIYEWMGKQVEDARPTAQPERAASSSTDRPSYARIVDIMRAINSEQGVRGRLARELISPPTASAEWDQARSDAAMMAEAGNMLLALPPPRGSLSGWRLRATDFRSAVETLLGAMDRHDFTAAQKALAALPSTCAACHAEYR